MLGIFSSMTLAEFVKERRGELRISQRELAKRSGLSPTYIANIELGVNPSTGKPISPTIDAMQALSKGLGVSYEELDRVARGLPRYPTEHPGWTPRVKELVAETEAMTPEDQQKMIEYARFLLHQKRQEGKQ